MNDNDTKLLSQMYDQISGMPQHPLILIKENFDPKEKLILEGIIDNLGGANNPTAVDIARRMMGLIRRDVPACGDNQSCMKTLDTKATILLNDIERLQNPMISRVISQYKDVSPTSKVKIVFALLSK